jgi:YtcA-like protein
MVASAGDGGHAQSLRAHAKPLPILAISIILSGCAIRGAPSFTLFGAFFPAWMFCALVGILGALGARVTFVATGVADFLPFQLFVCVSVGVIVAALAWLFWFGL